MLKMNPIMYAAGDLKGGMAFYEKALANNPQHADALYNMGVACTEGGDIHRAIYCYELALHFNPHCAEAHNNLGVLDDLNLQIVVHLLYPTPQPGLLISSCAGQVSSQLWISIVDLKLFEIHSPDSIPASPLFLELWCRLETGSFCS